MALSAIKCRSSEKALPFGDDFGASGLNDAHNVAQNMCRDFGIVIAQEAFPRLCDPYFRGRCGRRSCADVHMDGLKGIAFICPEIDQIRADLKDLRHFQILPAGKS